MKSKLERLFVDQLRKQGEEEVDEAENMNEIPFVKKGGLVKSLQWVL